MQGKELKLKKYYAEKFSETTGKEIQSQHWGGNRKLSTEGIAVDYFSDTVDSVIKETRPKFNSYISDENEQDARDSHYHTIHLFKITIELGLFVSVM